MRIERITHHIELLKGDYNPPPHQGSPLRASAVHLHRNDEMLAAKLVGYGTAIWNASGKIVYYNQNGADLCWIENGTILLSLEVRFGRSSQGISHELSKLTCDGSAFLSGIELVVPTGAVEYLVTDQTECHVLATWQDQSTWGYSVFQLPQLLRIGHLDARWTMLPTGPPAFSPNGRHIISVMYLRPGWWTDEVDEYWNHASAGGHRTAGSVSVHDVRTGIMSNHAIVLNVPTGWLPDDGEAPEWDRVWGPEFLDDCTVAFWLPDDSRAIKSLPFAGPLIFDRHLATRRPN